MGCIEKAFILICIYITVVFFISVIGKTEKHSNNKKCEKYQEELKRMGLK